MAEQEVVQKKQETQKELGIVWKDDGTGTETTSFCTRTVYKRRVGIQKFLHLITGALVIQPKDKRKGLGRVAFCPISLSRPEFRIMTRQKIEDYATPKLKEMLEEINDMSETATDAQFLTALGNKRDWRSVCAICLTEDIMGTTCGCGHTEIAVFRPCGHTLCMRPCFVELAKSYKQRAAPREVVINGQKFIVGSQMDPSGVKNFPCPMCKVNVDCVFQAEEVSYGNLIPKETIQEMVDEICTFAV